MLKKLRVSSYFKGSIGDTVQVSLKALETYTWLVQARFEYRGLRIRIPYLYRDENTTRVYFTSYAPYPGSDLAGSFAVSLEVLKHCGIEPEEVFLIYPNMNYVRKEELDHDAMWILSDCFATPKGNTGRKIFDVIKEKTPDLDAVLSRMEEAEVSELREPVRTSYCTKRETCRYFGECFPEYKNLPDNSILYLNSSSKKEKMFENGIRYLKDADPDLLDSNRIQYAQIMADRNGGLYADRTALKHWFRKIQSDPVIFLDFEWDLYLIPPYEGIKPVHPVCNQYSIHIADGDTIIHREFLGEKDCRRELAESLLRDIPDRGTICAFNAVGAEKIRIEELAEYFPDLKKPLLALTKRLVDLQVPFEAGAVYDVRMRGTYSLKVLTSLIDPEHTYGELDVSQGLEAVEIHRLYEKCEDLEEKERMARDLKEYCGKDTEELMKLYYWLESLCREKE